LPTVGTESWNRNLAQKDHVLPGEKGEEKLEKLLSRGRKGSEGTVMTLSNAFWEDEMVFAMDIDMLKT